MMQKPWFKLFIWFMATFFFFLTAGVIISIFRPGPSMNDVMRFMEGMMGAMDRSMIGVAMNLENDGTLKSVIVMTSSITIPVIMTSIAAGFGIRLWQRRTDDAG